MAVKREQTVREEIANAYSHLAGVIYCLVVMPFFAVKAWNSGVFSLFTGVLIFGVGMLLVYTFSTLYHAAVNRSMKQKLQIGDHISIYFLIAGTYTPLLVRYLSPEMSMRFLLIVWGIVAFGLVYKLFFTGRFKFLSVMIYLLMGWMILFMMPYLEPIPSGQLFWMALGGLFYTAGVWFYVKSNRPYYHAIWHLFVLAGTISHSVFVYNSLL